MLKWIIFCFIVIGVSGAPADEKNLHCKACHALVGEVRDLVLVGLTQGQIKDYFKDICQKLPSDEKDLCYTFLQDHSKELFDRLASDLTPDEICQKLPFCLVPKLQSVKKLADEPVEEPEVISVQENVKDTKCDICKFAVQLVDKFIGTNRSIEAINSTLEKLCNSLPGEIGDLCKQLEPDIIAAIQKGIPPDVACKEVRLCTDGSDGIYVSCDACYIATTAIGIKDPEAICSKLESCQAEVEAYQQEQTVNSDKEGTQVGSIECELCKFVIEAVDKLIGTNRSIEAINSTLEKICNSLPGEIGDLCKQYEPELLQVIQQGLDPDVACNLIKLCEAVSIPVPCDVCYTVTQAVRIKNPEGICSKLQSCQSEPEAFQQEPPQIAEEEDPQADWECDLCKFVVEAVESLIESNKSIAAINSTLEKLCNSLPSEFTDTCRQFEPQVIALIQQGLPPATVCQLIKVCTGSYPYISEASIPCDVCQAALEAIAGQKGVGICFDIPGVCLMPGQLIEQEPEPPRMPVPECEICEFIVQSVADQVQSFGKDKVVEVFERICGQMPEQEQQFCTKYGSAVIKAVMDGLTDPRETCVMMTVCGPSEPEEQEEVEEPVVMEMQQQSNVKDDAKCEICQLLMLILDQVVKDNKTMAEVNATLFKLCDKLPTKFDLKNLADARCELCKFSVGLLDDALKKGGPEINQTLYGICNALPEQMKAICLTLVPQIEKFAKQGLDPTQACQAVNMCPKTDVPSVPLPEMCDNCMGILEKAMPNEYNEEVADALCSNLCHGRHKRSLRQIQFGVGEVKKVEEDLTDVKKLKGIVECEACKIIVRTVDEFVKENKTIKQVNDTVYEICLKLTGEQLIQMCLQAAPKLVAAILNGLDPDKACISVGLCTGKFESLGFGGENGDNSGKLVKRSADKKTVGKLGSVECDVCKLVVQWLDSKITTNASKEEINKTVYQICESIPIEQFKDICLQYAPKIVEVFEKGVDPVAACQKIGLCTALFGDHMKMKGLIESTQEMKDKKSNLKDVKCDICKLAVQWLDSKVESNASKEEINKTVYELCNQLPGSLKDICLQYAPDIVNVFEKGLDPTATCQKIGLCTSLLGNPMKMKAVIESTLQEVKGRKSNLKDVKCDICKLAVQWLDSKVQSNASKEEINKTVYELCNQLPGSLKDICLQYAPDIVSVFEKGLDPTATCQKIGLCSSLRDQSKKAKEMDRVSNLSQKKMVQDTKKRQEPNDLKCEACKALVNIIDMLIKKNGSQSKINETIYKFCNTLPATEKVLCLAIAPIILNDTQHGFNATKVCQMVKACPQQDNRSLAPMMMTMMESPRDLEKSIGCLICDAVVQEIDAVLAKNASVTKINSTVFNLCNNLPASLKEVCNGIAPRIVELIAGGADPDFVCEKLGVCKVTRKSVNPVKQQPKDQICDLCKALVEFFAAFVPANETDQEANKTLHMICDNDIPDFLHQECIDLIPKLIHVVHDRNNPTKACEDIDICTNSMAAKVISYMVHAKSKKASTTIFSRKPVKCDICMKVMQVVYDDLSDNYPKIRRALISNVCDKLPATYKTLCTEISTSDLSHYWKQFLGNYTPSLMCELAGCVEEIYSNYLSKDSNRT